MAGTARAGIAADTGRVWGDSVRGGIAGGALFSGLVARGGGTGRRGGGGAAPPEGGPGGGGGAREGRCGAAGGGGGAGAVGFLGGARFGGAGAGGAGADGAGGLGDGPFLLGIDGGLPSVGGFPVPDVRDIYRNTLV